MSVNHGTTNVPPSLPSFAQAFSAPSFNSISSGNNSLPPIQPRHNSLEISRAKSPLATQDSVRRASVANPELVTPRHICRKRSRQDLPHDDASSESDISRQSPRLVRIKEESDHDASPPPPPPISVTMHPRQSHDMGAPSPSSVRPSPSKKRRVTISGAPHPLNTDVRPSSSEQTNSTPISPVVMGFTIMRDDPTAIEQVRSMLTVKQKQKALIEQRRGSVASVVSTATQVGPSSLGAAPAGPASINVVNPPPEDRRNPTKSASSSRPEQRSPNAGSVPTTTRRMVNPSVPSQTGAGPISTSNARPSSPSPMVVPSQNPPSAPPTQPAPTEPPSNRPQSINFATPPISLARRRASKLGGGKKKPADIVISPRDAHTNEQLQPFIQSAPPIPRAGASHSFTGRFHMELPRLPVAMSSESNPIPRLSGSHVPPTPTRLAMQRSSGSTSNQLAIPGPSNRSPPASVPIATSLIPPTPSALHHPSYTGDKSAFLAPFEIFYDALNDSKQLKNWLAEQMQKSNSLIQTLTQQQEKVEETVDRLVERRMSGMHEEIGRLYRRVNQLEDTLRAVRAGVEVDDLGRRQSMDVSSLKGKQQNGLPPPVPVPVASVTYTFPPVERAVQDAPRRISSPGWGERESQSIPESENGSPAPAPYDARRRLSVSAIRLDPRPPLPLESSQARASFSMTSQPQREREREREHEHMQLPPLPPHGAAPSPKHLPSSRSMAQQNPERPPLSRQLSGHRVYPSPPHPKHTEATERVASGTGQNEANVSPRQAGSRRNSMIVSPPMDESR